MTTRLLFVDDEIRLLRGLERSLRSECDGWDLSFTTDPAGAVEQVQREPFGVVVVDKQMPGMDGLTCLQRIRATSPHTVRLMLTGNTDSQSAIAAVNQGEVFRFLVKPVDRDVLVRALRDAVRHYELAASERCLLEQTLSGTVRALTDVLSLISPIAFGRARRISRYVNQLVAALAPPDAWQYEVAGMVAQIGCVTLPPELIAMLEAGQSLSPQDHARVRLHPEVTRELLAPIPRLEQVADMVALHLRPQSDARVYRSELDEVARGAQLLRVATEFDRLVRSKTPRGSVTAELRQTLWRCDDLLIAAADALSVDEGAEDALPRTISELQPGVTFAQDLLTDGGVLVVGHGHQVTQLLIRRLHGLVASGQLTPETAVSVVRQPDVAHRDTSPGTKPMSPSRLA